MNTEQVLAADGVLQWLGEQANTLPDDRQKGAEMALVMNLARMYLMEFATHLTQGDEPYDALLKTARGELELSQRQRDLWNALRPPGVPPAGADPPPQRT